MRFLAGFFLLCFLAVSANAQATLKQWYDGYNEEYFMNQLPVETIVSFGDPGEGNMAITLHFTDGTYHIVISRHYNPSDKEVKITLLHEMAHVKLAVFKISTDLDGHGPNFTAEMRRLADAGAFDDLW